MRFFGRLDEPAAGQREGGGVPRDAARRHAGASGDADCGRHRLRGDVGQIQRQPPVQGMTPCTHRASPTRDGNFFNSWFNPPGGGPRRCVHPHADVGDGLPALLPDVGPQYRRPDPDAQHTVRCAPVKILPSLCVLVLCVCERDFLFGSSGLALMYPEVTLSPVLFASIIPPSWVSVNQ